jgi:hypothetical protein
MKAVIGAVAWLAALALCWSAATAFGDEKKPVLRRVLTEFWRGILDPTPEYRIQFPPGPPPRRGSFLDKGNGVFVVKAGAGKVRSELWRVGEIAGLEESTEGLIATVRLDTATDQVEFREGYRIVRRTQGASLMYSVQTLIPPHRWEQLQEEWRKFQRRYQDQLIASLQRVLPDLLRESLGFLGSELERAYDGRSDEVAALLTRYRTEVARERVLPLLVEDIWPIVAEYGETPAREIGRELWDEVPLFGLAWRSMWDSAFSDGPEKLEAAFNQFVKDHAIPIIQAHKDEMESTLRVIFREITLSDTVAERVKEIVRVLAKDQELRSLLGTILKDLADSPRLKDYLRSKMEDRVLRQQLVAVNDLLQIFFTEVGNLLFLDETKDAINPDLAELLRVLVLRRDRQYLFIELGDGPPIAKGEVLIGERY